MPNHICKTCGSDTQVELRVAGILCQVALGRNRQAAEGIQALVEYLNGQPPSLILTGPWHGLTHFAQKTAQRELAANRDWLLRCLDALLLEGRDDVLKALRRLPQLR
jgi:hypothetical protein